MSSGRGRSPCATGRRARPADRRCSCAQGRASGVTALAPEPPQQRQMPRTLVLARSRAEVEDGLAGVEVGHAGLVEPDGAAQLGDEVVAVALGQLGPCRIVAPERIVDVLVDLGQPPPVGLASLVVQHRQTGTRGCEVVAWIDRGRRRRRQRPLLDATRSSTWNSRPGSASIIKHMAIMAAARAAPGRSPAVHSRPCWASHAAIDASKSPFP